MTMRACVFAIGALAATVGGAHAQENPLAKLKSDAPPVALEYLKEQGVSLTALDDTCGGLNGYLGESPTGKMATFYVSPDGSHMVSGLCFRKGVNVTGVQISDMQKRFEAARKAAERAERDTSSSTPLSVDSPRLPGVPEGPDLDALASADAAAPAAAWVTDQFDDAQLFEDLQNAAWFSVGVEEAPVIYAAVDPNCPFCHALWAELEPKVRAKELKVRLIMFQALRGSRDDALSLLSLEQPGRAWLAGQGSTDGAEIDPPPAKGTEAYQRATHYLDINQSFVRKYGIDATPWLVYVGRDDKVRMNKGLPKNVDAFLSAL